MTMTSPSLKAPGVSFASGTFGTMRSAAQVATFLNDNAEPCCGVLPEGARMLVLCQEIDASARPILTIRILLADGTLLPPLHVARDSFEIIALWKGFARSLNLPLGMTDENGDVIVITHAPGEECHARRGGSPLTNRRTRTASKRQVPLRPWQGDALISPRSA